MDNTCRTVRAKYGVVTTIQRLHYIEWKEKGIWGKTTIHFIHRRRVSNLASPVYKARPLSAPPFYSSPYMFL